MFFELYPNAPFSVIARTVSMLVRGKMLTAALRLCLLLRAGGRGQKPLPTVFAAKVERLSIRPSNRSSIH
jgi:hypothetical protein